MHLLSHGTIDGFLQGYGLMAVFVVVGLESMGVPLPGETTLISAAVLAAATGELSIGSVIASAAGGAILGDNAGYWIGRRLGLRLLVRHGARVGLTEPKLKLGQYLFRRYGGAIVFFGRFIAVLRAFAAVLAGANAFPWLRFLAFNAAGALVWATAYGLGAYWLGRSVHKVAGPVGLCLAAVAIGAIALGWRLFKQREAALMAAAERAFPRPLDATGR